MENDTNSYLKTDHGIILNEKCIRWVKKMNECLHVSEPVVVSIRRYP